MRAAAHGSHTTAGEGSPRRGLSHKPRFDRDLWPPCSRSAFPRSHSLRPAPLAPRALRSARSSTHRGPGNRTRREASGAARQCVRRVCGVCAAAAYGRAARARSGPRPSRAHHGRHTPSQHTPSRLGQCRRPAHRRPVATFPHHSSAAGPSAPSPPVASLRAERARQRRSPLNSRASVAPVAVASGRRRARSTG